MQKLFKAIRFYNRDLGVIRSYYGINIYFMIKLKTFVTALDMLENEIVSSDNELKDNLKRICFSELETIKKQIELL